jgi:hypothetical protein
LILSLIFLEETRFILPFKPRNPEVYCDECFKKMKSSGIPKKTPFNSFKKKSFDGFKGKSRYSKK